LARLESGAEDSAHELIDLKEMVAEVAEDARFEARAAGKDVHLQSAGPAAVSGRPELLHRAIDNVVRNAVRFSPEGAAVEVALRLDPGASCAFLSVTDRGPGVAAEELERIFEPFYRANGNDSKSFGLGLAIAERAVNAHGGVIRAENAPGAGLRVVISLPLA
jgi:signal transduction histidine kinase